MLSRTFRPLSRYQFFITPLISNKFSTIRRYTKDHEWVEYHEKDNLGSVGITDYAQKELGDIVHLDLPNIGAKYNKGDSIGAVESVKVAADIYSPITGTIAKINDQIKNDPALINKDAEKAWFVTLKVENKKEIEELMTHEGYMNYLKEKHQKVEQKERR